MNLCDDGTSFNSTQAQYGLEGSIVFGMKKFTRYWKEVKHHQTRGLLSYHCCGKMSTIRFCRLLPHNSESPGTLMANAVKKTQQDT